MRVFKFEPDWSGGVTETLEWKTDILQSYSGAEQRISRRLTPRRLFEFSLLLANSEKAKFENTLFYYGANTWLLPIFNDVSQLSNPVEAGADIIYLSTSGKDFAQNKQIYITSGFSANDKAEVATILSIQHDSITLEKPLTNSFNAGCRCFPLHPAVLTDPPTITRFNGFLYQVQIRFRISEDNVYSDDISDFPSYRGFPVVNLSPDFNDNLTGQYDRLLLELDNECGIPYRTDTALRPFFLQSFIFYSIGRSEQSRLRRLFYALRGRQRAAWTSSNNQDMHVVSDISNGVFNINSIGLSEFGIAPGRQDIAIVLRSGETIYARITNVAALANGTERIAIDNPLTAAQNAILSLSFLTLSRLESDEVVWQHITDSDGLATIGINFKGVRDELESV